MLKQTLSILFAACSLYACKDDDLKTKEDVANKSTAEKGMQRVIVGSSSEIEALLDELGEPTGNCSRAVQNTGVQLSDNEELFESLVEANRKKVMASLTAAQLDTIRNDEEDLEFCPSDSVIADIRFAQLLNADREIQVGDTVYKYVKNGVAFTPAKTASELKDVESLVSDIKATDQSGNTTLKVSENVSFSPMDYRHMEYVTDRDDNFDEATGGGSPSSGSSQKEENITLKFTSYGAQLSNGEVIPQSDIREVDFNGRGDGNWLHWRWTKIWGRNIVALIRFQKRRQLNLNFYHQNYRVYSNTGTKLKMQKKVCGIWWNIKAETMIHGWETATIQYSLPNPIPPISIDSSFGKNPTVSTMHTFPFDKKNRMLIKIPFINYNFTSKDLYKAFTMAAKTAFDKASSWAKSKAGKADNIGLLCEQDKYTYVIHGPYSKCVYNKRSVESKFDSRWFPGDWEFTFSFASKFKLVRIKIPSTDGIDIYRGSVYGAIKYKGKWLAARIYKDKDPD